MVSSSYTPPDALHVMQITMQRLFILLVPGLIAIGLYLGINSFESVGNQIEDNHNTPSLNYDAYSEGINTILYDAQGGINYTLNAVRQIHFNNDVTELEKPFIRLFQDGYSRWNIAANSGRISAVATTADTSNQTIELSGNVEVYNLDKYGNRIIMSTDFLSFDPEMETLQTDRPVTVVTDYLLQTSIGMVVNLKLDKIEFHNEIRGSYEQAKN
jgi:LPS export ABC transporter protein LptC